MAQRRVVNIIPHTKIKKELPSDDDEDNVSCRICSKTFASEIALRSHARMEHVEAFLAGEESLWKEVHAGEDTPEGASIPSRTRGAEREKEIQPITGPFECLQPSAVAADGTCHQTFSSCCEYSAHDRDKHSRRRKMLSCQVCEKPLSCEGNLKTHMRIHTGDRPFKCKHCKKSFTDKSGLNHHVRIHTKEKPYRCVVCSKIFSQSTALRRHMRTHTQVSPFQCVLCQKRFKQSSTLKRHLKTHVTVSQMFSNEEQTVVPGDANTSITEVSNEQLVEGEGGGLDTGKGYDREETVKDEVEGGEEGGEGTEEGYDQEELKEEPIEEDEVCGAGFDSGEALLKHQKAHEKQPFVCDICYKQFTRKDNLERHMRIYTGDRPFKCKYCKKAFKRKSTLNEHELIHTKEKPYRCVVCSKMFNRPTHLRRHMRTHTQVSPFQCVLCQKRFKQSSTLKSHLETHVTVSQMCSNEEQTVVPGDANTSITEVSNEQLVEGEGGGLDTGEGYDQEETIKDELEGGEEGGEGTEEVYDQEEPKEETIEEDEGEDTPEGASIPSRTRGAEGEKEIQPITGPFECLQPSAVAVDGTCHQTFSSCCEYSAHVGDEHARRHRARSCQVCEKPLAGRHNRAYSCEVCGAGFDSGEALLKHQKAHEKQPFVCDICYKQFKKKGSMERHKRIHTGDRPFKCKHCKKSFTDKSNWNRHVLIHTKEKPHRCVVCSKMFSQSTGLRDHMRTHTQVLPFQCVLCQKRFKRSSKLKSHLKTHVTVSQMFSNEEQTVVPGDANTSITEVSNEQLVEGEGGGLDTGEGYDQEETIKDELEGGEEGGEGTEEVYDQEELKEETIEEDEGEDTPEGASIPSRTRGAEGEKEIQPIT